MDSERNAGDWLGPQDGPRPDAGWDRIEQMVPPVVVTAISIAAVLASVMQPRSEPAQDVTAIVRSIAQVVRTPPLLDDGSLRPMEQPGSLAAGSRVLAQRPGPG